LSYHILHQFDEQWLADLKQDGSGRKGSHFSNSSNGEYRQVRSGRFIDRESNRWIVVAAAILMATFALLFAIDASHRAEVLQQRLDAVERTVNERQNPESRIQNPE
jgi:hypothetical protein